MVPRVPKILILRFCGAGPTQVSQSPVCCAVLIKEIVSISVARHGSWNAFGVCLCVGTGNESASRSGRWGLALPVFFSTLRWRDPRSISSKRMEDELKNGGKVVTVVWWRDQEERERREECLRHRKFFRCLTPASRGGAALPRVPRRRSSVDPLQSARLARDRKGATDAQLCDGKLPKGAITLLQKCKRH